MGLKTQGQSLVNTHARDHHEASLSIEIERSFFFNYQGGASAKQLGITRVNKSSGDKRHSSGLVVVR